MRKLYCLTIGFFMLTVSAENEDLQGYLTEQTKGMTVTKDSLLNKGNTIRHGTEAIPAEKTHPVSAVTVTGKFPAAVLYDTRPTAPHKATQITKGSAASASPNSGPFRNGQNSLKPTRGNPLAIGIHTESEMPLIFNYDKIVFSSTQAASELMMNGTSEPEVHLTADAVKASFWLHTLLDNRNHRKTDSITITSADGGPGVPILSASHPRVIDNLAAWHNDNDDKRSQGRDEKGISNLERKGNPFGAIHSVFQSNPAKDSVRGNTVTNFCLTCLKDRRTVTRAKSMALPADSLSTEGLTLRFSQLVTPLLSLHQQSAREEEEIQNNGINHQNITKNSSFGLTEQLVFNLTFPHLSFNKNVNHSQSILNNFHVKSFLTDTGAVAFDAQRLAEMSSVTQKDIKKPGRHTYLSKTSPTERAISTTRALYRSSKSLSTVRKPEKDGKQDIFGEQVSVRDPQSKLIYFRENNKKSPHSFFKNVFIHHQPMDFSSVSSSDTPIITEAAHRSQKSALPRGTDHSAALHPTVRMKLIEDHSAVSSLSIGRPTTVAVRNAESHSLAGAGSLIFPMRSQMPLQPSSQTKEPTLTLLLKDSAIKFESVTLKGHLTDEQSQTFSTVNSIAKQAFVDPPGPVSKPAMEESQTPTIATKKVAPAKFFLSESRRDFGEDVFVFTPTTVSNKPSSERPTLSRLSEMTQERTFDVSNDNHVAPTPQSFVKYNRDLITQSLIVHNSLKPGDKNTQVLTVAAEDENKEMIKTEGKQGKEIRVMKEIPKLQEEDEGREEKLGNKREELFRSDKNESRKQEFAIKSGVEMNQNTGPEEDEMTERKAETSRKEGGETVGEEGVTLRQNKEEVTHDEVAERKGMSKINTEYSTQDVAEKQAAESLMKEGAEARGEETVREEDIKHNRGIGSEDMTNAPFAPTANSKELNRDKGHTVTNPSLCHTLIKHMGVTQHKGIHLGENTARIAEMKNKQFSDRVTSNRRPLHLTLRPQSPKPSRMTPFPKEPYPKIKPHPSVLTKRGATPSPAEESTRNKVVGATLTVTDVPKMAPKLSQTLGVSASKFSRASKPTTSPHSSGTKSAHPVLNSISNMLSLTTPRMAITAGFQRAQSHFTVNSSSLRVSIIYSASDNRHKFTTSVSTANSLLQTADEREQTEHFIPAHIFESSVEKPLTSNVVEEVNISTSLNPALSQQMYNDSSTRPPTAAVLSSEAHISIGQLQPHQGQSAPQISQSSSPSSDMTSGQQRSFKLSEQTAHSDALHAPVDDNEQRSVQTLIASMSPEAKSDQSPHSSMSPLLNLMLLGGDSLPGTYSMTGLTRSVSEKDILSAKSDSEYANSGSGRAASLLGTADGTNQTEEGDSEQKMMTLAAKRSDIVTKQMAGNREEKNNPPFTVQTIGRSKPTKKLAVKTPNGNNHSDLFSVYGDDEANNTEKTALENNHLSQLESYNEASTKPIVFAIKATHRNEQAINEDSVPVTKDFIIPMLDTDYQTNSTAFVESGSLPESPQMQANDVTRSAISDKKSLVAQTAEKQRDPSTPRGSVGDSALPAPHIHFRSEVKVPTQQTADWTMNVTSAFQITTPKTNDFVSVGSAFRSRGAPLKAHESVRTTSKSVQSVIEKSSRAEHAERMAQPNSHIEPLSLREPPATPTTGKLPPAVKGKNTTETQSVDQPEHEISGQDIEQSQHAPPGMTAITHPINDPGQGIHTGLFKVVNNARGAHDTTPTIVVEYSLLKDIKTAVTTKSAFEARHSLHERTPAEHILSTADQHEKHALLEKTSISQVILGVVTDLFPRTAILPTEIINKSSCGTIGCAKSGKTIETTIGAGDIDRTAREKMHEAQAGNMGRVHFDAAHTHGNCSTDCSASGEATAQATNPDYAALSPANKISDHDHATETARKNAKRMTYEISAQTRRVLVDTAQFEGGGTLEQAQFAEKTTQRQSHRESSAASAAEVTLSEPEETTAQTTVKTTEQTLLAGKKTKTQLNRGAAKAEIYEAQNATRSARAVSKGETALQESGRRLLLPELPRMKHTRRTSPHLYLSGVTEVSDDLCGSGNYTAEMSLNVGRGVEPGDTVPAMGNLRVIINLKTNNSRLNLQVTSCCLSPTIQPELANSTCCLFSRLAAEPAGITLLPSALSTSASFTISLFQMINYSVVYLHCDLSVCLKNRSDCERQCLQQRSTFSSEGPETVVTNLKNRISFGPVLKEVRNSTFPEEMDPSELDLVLVIVGLVVGSSLVTVTLLLVWLAYRRRANWLLHAAAPPRACCGCLHPGGDLILP